jgi:4-hydroxybenzoate polyprenyltransferase
VTTWQAIFTAAFLFGLMLGLIMILPYQTWIILCLYIAQNILYSLWLKKVAILDVLVIAMGFVLRLLMGGYAIGVEVSPYLLIATFMLSLFLGFSKRYYELRRLNQPESAVLGAYNINMLDRMISVSCGAALMTYALYTVEIAKRMNSVNIVFTLVFVVFGLFRYLQYVYFSKKGGAPEKILYTDYLFVGNILAWLICLVLILLQAF